VNLTSGYDSYVDILCVIKELSFVLLMYMPVTIQVVAVVEKQIVTKRRHLLREH